MVREARLMWYGCGRRRDEENIKDGTAREETKRKTEEEVYMDLLKREREGGRNIRVGHSRQRDVEGDNPLW